MKATIMIKLLHVYRNKTKQSAWYSKGIKRACCWFIC